jgi:hypothetical protein
MAGLALIIGVIYIRRRNQGQQQSDIAGPVGQVSKANHDVEKDDGIEQSTPVLAEPYY